jgi:hypothetical protein
MGVYKCDQCRKPRAAAVMAPGSPSDGVEQKKGISSNQLRRTLGVALNTARFMSRRIPEAMRVFGAEPTAGQDLMVESDETNISCLEGQPAKGRRFNRRGTGGSQEKVVLTLG